jgi:methanethiol S-methyltransferase
MLCLPLVLSIGLFGFVHSLLAANWVKDLLKNRFYRLLFNLISILTFGGIYLIYTKTPVELFFEPPFGFLLSSFLIGLGFGFILAVLYKYNLAEFSGFDAFQKQKTDATLATSGFLSYVRHPLYSAIIILMLFVFIAEPSSRNLASGVFFTVYILIGIHFEEKKLIATFGQQYIDYQAKTPRLLPKFW